MVLCLVLVLSLSSWLAVVKVREKRLAKNRVWIREIVEKMLSEQIEILSGGDFGRVTLELEISKFIKDCLIINLERGECDIRDIRKAHGWLKQEFKEEFELWKRECEENQ